jgi:hypothetical protein
VTTLHGVPPVPQALWHREGFRQSLPSVRRATGALPTGAMHGRQSPQSFVLESNGGIAVISGKSDTPRLFVKTGTVQSAGFSQAKELLGIAQAENLPSSANSLDRFARDRKCVPRGKSLHARGKFGLSQKGPAVNVLVFPAIPFGKPAPPAFRGAVLKRNHRRIQRQAGRTIRTRAAKVGTASRAHAR